MSDSQTLPTVFICHSSEDKPGVRKLAKQMDALGVRAWLDEWEIRPGDSLIGRIQSGISETAVFVIILSASSIASRWCQRELAAALALEAEKNLRVIAVVIEDIDAPIFLKDKLYVDLSKHYFAGLLKLVSAILHLDQRRVAVRIESPSKLRSFAQVREAVAELRKPNAKSLGQERWEELSRLLGEDISDHLTIVDLGRGRSFDAC